MEKILIKNGRVVNPDNKIDEVLDILIEGSKIKYLKKPLSITADKIINAQGKIVVPGLIDMHVHLREPGREDEETIASGTKAAAMGGITSVCCMANTNPCIDNVSGVKFVLLKAEKEGLINVFPIGSITKNLLGKELSSMGEMSKAGIVAVSDDGNLIMNAKIMRRALEYAKTFNLPTIVHCEDLNLSHNGVMNEGKVSAILGLAGIPREAENIMVARDIALANLTGAKLHIAHVSTKESVTLIKEAKRKGIKVTCETCPHYFTLTEKNVGKYNTNMKMKPPLRTQTDINAIKEGLAEGTIDCIVSDHAPHLDIEKNTEFNLAAFGIIGLETLLPLIMVELVEKKVLSLSEAIKKVTLNPATILGLKEGRLKKGEYANLTIIDPQMELKIGNDFFHSKCKNSPFIGRKLKGFAVTTIVEGRIVMENRTFVSN
ncbi:dihydroorotase [bacterium]|nr:dihydroorotase [bacterium]